METKNLYLPNSNYNIARIFEDLKNVILNNDGAITKRKYTEKTLIHNRGIAEAIHKEEDRLEKVMAGNMPEEKKEVFTKNAGAKLEELKKESDAARPFESTFTTWCGHSISFVYEGVYYYFSMDSNPFFPASIHKIRLDENNSYIGEYYIDTIEEKPFLYDCIYNYNVSYADVREMACQLFNYLLAAPMSKRYIDRQKKRVPNLYDGGYHYETIIKQNNKRTQIEIEEQ